ncbi:hypothetical protein GQ600_19308 [Phytophthora cactorum]|nr:hypothetical protein GQ600_19308 [Phytophthora cactorum]
MRLRDDRIYRNYGDAVGYLADGTSLIPTCIRSQHTDRSEATAEVSLREITGQLQNIWSATFQADAVIWRMWTNPLRGHQSLHLGSSSIGFSSRAEQQLSGLTRPARLVLDCVNASLEDNAEQKRQWEAMGRRRQLLTRKSTIESFLADILLPSANDVPDPLEEIEKCRIDHQSSAVQEVPSLPTPYV